MISKIRNKTMRLACRFNFTRNLAIALKKNNSKIERIENKELDIDIKEHVNKLKERGFSPTFTIPNTFLEKILEYIKTATFTGLNSGVKATINYKNPQNPNSEADLWYKDSDIYENCKTVKNLAHDSKLLEIATKYLGKEPKLHDVHTWWSFPQKKENYSPTYGYHYDIDSLKFVKFFIYLTDVDKDCGPHVIISNTHKRKTWFQKFNRRLTDKKVSEVFSKKEINIMLANSGQGFFEDTFCYHKGTSPKRPRLILQVEYTI